MKRLFSSFMKQNAFLRTSYFKKTSCSNFDEQENNEHIRAEVRVCFTIQLSSRMKLPRKILLWFFFLTLIFTDKQGHILGVVSSSSALLQEINLILKGRTCGVCPHHYIISDFFSVSTLLIKPSLVIVFYTETHYSFSNKFTIILPLCWLTHPLWIFWQKQL